MGKNKEQISTSYYKVPEVAKKLDVSKGTVRHMCRDGLFQGAFKKNKNGPWLIPINEIDNLKNSQTGKIKNFLSKDDSFYSPQKLMNFFRNIIKGVVLIVGIFAIISVFADFDTARQQLANWGIYSKITKEQEGEVLILIPQLEYSDGIDNTQIQNEIKMAIERAVNDLNIQSIKVRVETVPKKLDPEDKESAEKLGEKYNAHIVIWGEDTGVRVTVNFLHRKAIINWLGGDYVSKESNLYLGVNHFSISDTNNTQIGNPAGYTQLVTEHLPNQLTYMAFYVIGQSLYSIDNDGCIRAINKGLDYFNVSQLNLLSGAYYWLGICYEENGQLDKALENFKIASLSEPRSHLTHIKLGQLYLTQENNFGEAVKHYSQAIELLKDIELASGQEYANIDWQVLAYYGRAGVKYLQILEEIGEKSNIVDFSEIKAKNPQYTFNDYVEDYFITYKSDLQFCINDTQIADDLFTVIIDFDDNLSTEELNVLTNTIIEDKLNLFMVLGQFDKALAEVQRSRDMGVIGPALYLVEAMAYEALGKPTLALEKYQGYHILNNYLSEPYIVDTINYLSNQIAE
jgi:tetratricopeptide (TPR) repeat protein